MKVRKRGGWCILVWFDGVDGRRGSGEVGWKVRVVAMEVQRDRVQLRSDRGTEGQVI